MGNIDPSLESKMNDHYNNQRGISSSSTPMAKRPGLTNRVPDEGIEPNPRSKITKNPPPPRSSSSKPNLNNAYTLNNATNPKKLFTLGNAVKLGLAGVAVGAGLELTGVTDFTPLGPNRGVTPPPGQVVKNDLTMVISEFPGKDISGESQDSIQRRIVETLNKAAEISPEFSFDSKRLVAYYGNTLKPLKHESKVIGAIIQANVKATPSESGDGKPHAILYQEANTKVQITFVPIKEARAETLTQDGDNSVVLTIPAVGNPTVITKQGNLNSLINNN